MDESVRFQLGGVRYWFSWCQSANHFHRIREIINYGGRCRYGILLLDLGGEYRDGRAMDRPVLVLVEDLDRLQLVSSGVGENTVGLDLAAVAIMTESASEGKSG